MKQSFGLIGFPLSHSFSKSFFTAKFKKAGLTDCSYESFPMESLSDLRKWVGTKPDLKGLNVTIPHKVDVMEYLDEIDEYSLKIGSVNTLKIEHPNGQLIIKGFNTDYMGFIMALKPLLKLSHNRALILGNGGSSKAVQFVLNQLGIDFIIVSRDAKADHEISYEELNENHIHFHRLIVNTTPLGMYPDVDAMPQIPYEFITADHLLFDLVYNPEQTLFLKKGEEKGAMISNGLTMLHQQAEASWEIWNR